MTTSDLTEEQLVSLAQGNYGCLHAKLKDYDLVLLEALGSLYTRISVAAESRIRTECAEAHEQEMWAQRLIVKQECAERERAIDGCEAKGERNVKLCYPLPNAPANKFDCVLVDVGYSDNTLVVECPELDALKERKDVP